MLNEIILFKFILPRSIVENYKIGKKSKNPFYIRIQPRKD